METRSAFPRGEASVAEIGPRQETTVLQRLKQSLDVGSVLLIVAVAVGIYNFIDWSQVGSLDFGIVVKFWRPLAIAAGMTIAITATAFMLGLLMGVCLAVLLELPIGPLRYLINAYIELW